MRKRPSRRLLGSGPDRDRLLRELAGQPGQTYSAIGRHPQIRLTRERVRQLLGRLQVQLTRRQEPVVPILPAPRCMTPAEFRAALTQAGISQGEAARRLSKITGREVNARTVRRWCQDPESPGARRISPDQQRRINRMLGLS